MQGNTEQNLKKFIFNMQSTVKERLIKYLKLQGISQRVFEKTIGVSNGYVNNIRVSIQPDKIQRIAQHYPDLNTGWLLCGEGDMLKGNLTGGGTEITYREIFDKLSKLVDMVGSQQQTISEQQQTISEQQQTISKQTRMIDPLISGRRIVALKEDDADSADVK